MARHRLHRFLYVFVCLALMCGCTATRSRPPVKPPVPARAEPVDTAWGRQFAQASPDPRNLSGVHVLEAGIDGLAARVQIIRRAERSLDLQYFIFRGDIGGSLIRDELRKAAERGVIVRVLVDDGDTVAGDEKLLELDGYQGMQVRVFNPFDYRGHNKLLRNLDFVLHKRRLDYRMHNKLLVADDSVVMIGGRNIGDQYFQIDPVSQFSDDDVFVVGAAVGVLRRSFDEFWNSDLVVPAMQLAGRKNGGHAAKPPLADDFLMRIESGQPLADLLSRPTMLNWARVTVLYDSPEKRLIERRQAHGRLMSESVEKQISDSTREVEIVSPYFVPSDHELALLLDARRRGNTVKTLTNSLETNPEVAAHSGYAKIRLPLLKSGASVYEVRAKLDSVLGSGQSPRISRYGNYALHGKMYVFDQQRVFLGSWNYDQRSLRINTEIGVLIESPPVAAAVAHRFEEMTSPQAAYQVALESAGENSSRLVWKTEFNHQPVVLKVEPSRGWWLRFKSRLLALLPLQPEL